MELEQLKAQMRVEGLAALGIVTIVAVEPHGPGIANVTFRTDDGERWVGLVGGTHVDARPGGFVVARDAAKAQLDAGTKGDPGGGDGDGGGGGTTTIDPTPPPPGPTTVMPTTYYGAFGLDRVRAIRQIEDLLENVIDQLANAEGAEISITLEISARSAGFDDRIQRVVKENGNQLGVKTHEFED